MALVLSSARNRSMGFSFSSITSDLVHAATAPLVAAGQLATGHVSEAVSTALQVGNPISPISAVTAVSSALTPSTAPAATTTTPAAPTGISAASSSLISSFLVRATTAQAAEAAAAAAAAPAQVIVAAPAATISPWLIGGGLLGVGALFLLLRRRSEA